jgi:hypothetical protein
VGRLTAVRGSEARPAVAAGSEGYPPMPWAWRASPFLFASSVGLALGITCKAHVDDAGHVVEHLQLQRLDRFMPGAATADATTRDGRVASP